MDSRLGGGVAHNTDGLSRSLASTSICLGALSANRQATQVADTSIAFNTLKALEIHTDLAAKIAFDDVFAILNRVDDLRQLLFAQIFRANGGVNVRLGQNVFRVAGADAVNVTQGDVDALVWRNFYSDDAGHKKVSKLVN